MQLEPLPKKQGADWSSGVIAFLLAICALLFYVYPKYNQWKEGQVAVKAAQQQLDDLTQQKTKVQQSVGALEQNQQTFKLVDQAVPNNPSIPDLYAHIELLAQASNMKLISIQATDTGTDANSSDPAAAQADTVAAGGSDSAPPTLGTVKVTAELRGNTAALKDFLTAVEQSLRFIDVQTIAINEGQNNEMSYQIEFNTYYQKK